MAEEETERKRLPFAALSLSRAFGRVVNGMRPYHDISDGSTHRERSCAGKMPYSTEADARNDRRKLASLPGASRMSIYPCIYCGRFHIGHDRHRKARIARREARRAARSGT